MSFVRSSGHPCFSNEKINVARIHLPVAGDCNLGCNYCNALQKSTNKHIPGACSKILSTAQALELLRKEMDNNPNLTVVGISGPGDPLANESTFSVLESINRDFPGLLKCICTNGIALADQRNRLASLKIDAITLTINSFKLETLSRIYGYVKIGNRIYKGIDSSRIILEKQIQALEIVAKENVLRKINIIYMEDINSDQITAICERVSKMGMFRFNIMKLVPLNKFTGHEPNSGRYNII